VYSKEIESFLRKRKIKIGDRITVTKRSNTLEGILMPRGELGDSLCLVIKLDNGYNTGMKFEKGMRIKRIRRVWSQAKREKEERKMIFDKKLPTISIIGTGGTVASRVDYKIGGVYASFSAKDIATQVPDLKSIANIETKQAMNIMSEDITPDKWAEIAKYVGKAINSGARGVIVTHGTDTLHYTSAALSFMLRSLPCPVALVGTQRSSDRGSSDSVMNVACAANFVTNSDVAEACVIMHGTPNDDYCLAIRGTKCRKMHTSRRDAFRPINELPLAKIHWLDKKIEIVNKTYRKRNDGKIKTDCKLDPRVALIKFYPGLNPDIFDFYVKKGCKGFVIEATGLGHVATLGKYSLLPKIESAVKSGIPVVITSQCLYGRVHPTIYRNLIEVSKRGAIYGEDMLPETALVKLMWVLGHTKNVNKIREMMMTNYTGEISSTTDTRTFLY
jgi:glutamyl-tRNA(Gln) amidotransferase subunit D